jgi:serine/threonine protein phosphatase 1
VGDIHGRCDLLESMLIKIEKRCRSDRERPLVIFLGDYVDRGPQSSLVLERLLEIERLGWRARFIAGNHEEAMVRFLSTPLAGLSWFEYGGRETAKSYGVEAPRRDAAASEWLTFHASLSKAIPEAHKRFLWGLEDSVEVGDYLFVHAGVDPGRPLSAQTPRDLRWIRGRFLQNTRWLGKVIVHGHTPSEEPYSDELRIGVDTGGYKTGLLTAVLLQGTEREFLQATAKSDGFSA